MSTTVAAYIEAFNEEYDHPYDAVVLLKYINAVEAKAYGETIKEYATQYYSRTANAYQFSLPSGVNFTEVRKLYVGGKKHRKVDVRAYNEPYTYWYEDGKLCIYPACSMTDTTYTSEAGEITFTDSTIVSTGKAFNFAAGDVVIVSGCATNTDNNKTAVIVSVDADNNTLKFADGTFTAGAEPGEITIKAAKIKMVYQKLPTPKLIANIDTDTLLIPDRFQEIYDYFLMSKIAYLQKEYNEAANHMAMFNSAVTDYERWWEDNRPLAPIDDMMAEEDIAYTTADFDRE